MTTDSAIQTVLSVEEICRSVLCKAIEEGLVTFNATEFISTEDPAQLTCGDLCGLANHLSELLHRINEQAIAAQRERDAQIAESLVDIDPGNREANWKCEAIAVAIRSQP